MSAGRREPDWREDELSEDECRRLLPTQQIGRLGVVVDGYPVIFPLNYTVDGDVIVFRTVAGEKLGAAQGRNVTFEVDELDPVHLRGWSILVRGVAEEVRDETRRESLASSVTPWAPGERSHVVRVIPRRITGRRIRRETLNTALDVHGYL